MISRIPAVFLGDDYFELRMDDVYFAGIRVQDRQAVKRTAEKANIGWQNDKCTGHLHPANNKRLKINLAERLMTLRIMILGILTRATLPRVRMDRKERGRRRR